MKTQRHRNLFVTGVIVAFFIGLAFALRSFPVDSKAAEGHLYVDSDVRVNTPAETPLIRVRSEGATRVDFSVWKFDAEAFFRQHGSLSLTEQVMPEDAVLVREFWERPRQGPAGSGFRVDPGIGSEGKGVYMVTARDSEGREASDWFIVTDLGLVTKQGEGKLLVYAYTFSKEAPCEGARITIYNENREIIGEGTTDRDGLFAFDLTGTPRGEMFILGVREEDDGVSFAQISSWRYWEDARYKVYIYTDRPIYRPGQKVSIKGILREDKGGVFEVLADEEVTIEVRDSTDAVIYRADTKTNKYGSVTGELTLGDEPSLGDYRVLVNVCGSTHNGWFKVAEYRKPEYEVTVTADKDIYVAGDEISARISANYYFGKPVAGAKVKYAVYAQPYWRSYYSTEDLGYYPVFDAGYGYYGELVDSGEGVTSDDGTMQFTIKTDKIQRSQRLYLEATVTDESLREVTGRSSVILSRGLFDITVQPAKYVVPPGEPSKILIKAETIDGQPHAVDLEWQSMKETWDGDKSIRWKEQSGKVSTGKDGKAEFEFTPKEEGSYLVEVSGVDERGNRIVEEAYVWVAGYEGSWSSYGGTEIEIITDKDVYEIGDVAKVLVNTTFDHVWALITIEGRDLASWEVVELTGHTRLFEIPITQEFSPNSFFTVTFVRGKQLYMQEKVMYVSVKENFLDISITPDKETYSPGERASYTIKTLDHAGRPVQAEVSIGVVDASIYAIQGELAPDIRKAFYGSIWNQIMTNYSFPRWYYGGADKEAGDSDVRRDFPDTAFWAPVVMTDRKGTAKVSFTMPDSLTTWRATVRGHTLATQVGSATRDVKTTKDLIVRMAVPRFFRLGDTTYISTIVHNYTDRQINAKVSLKAEGVALVDGKERGVDLAPGAQATLNWKIKCDTVGVAKFTASASAGRLSDALELNVSVLPFGNQVQVFDGGEVGKDPAEDGEVKIVFDVPEDVIDSTLNVEVRLAPSVAATALGALEYLTSYPYGCTEQTMNSFLPNIIVSNTLRELGIEMPEIEKDLPDMVNAGLARLYKYQHWEGGWGWWGYDEPKARTTAYVVYGLNLAKKAGYHVDDGVLMRGKRALGVFLNKPKSVDDLVYNLFIMSEVGERFLPRLDEMIVRREELSNYSLALLTLTLKNVERLDDARIVLGDLLQRARGDNARTYWDASQEEWYWADNRIETTAYALLAILAVEPDHPVAPQVVRWLSEARMGNAWTSTKDTAIAVMALTEYMKLREEIKSNITANVSLNGKQVERIAFSGKNAWDKESVIEIDPSQLVPGKNELVVKKTGTGRLYYSVSCKYVTPSESMAEVDNGLKVSRNYYRKVQGSNTFEPITGRVNQGDEIIVRLTVRTDRPRTYIMIEDPLPSGFEVIDKPVDRYSWDFWFAQKEIRDEKVAIFSTYLDEGENEIVYSMRAERPGEYKVMPTMAWGMYLPDVYGASRSHDIVVEMPTLAGFSTTVKEPELNRNHNIALAAQAIDGFVLQPGEVFSLDKVLGPRLEAQGYKEARVISGGKSVPGVAGGICQVSTTLYNAVLRAGLEIVERHPHSQPVDYVPPGFDATISEESGLDLRFKNQLDVPVTISARTEGPRLTVEVKAGLLAKRQVEVTREVLNVERPRLMAGGNSENEKISAGKPGIRVAVWRTIDTGGTVVRELISEDYYKPIHAVAYTP